jgi:hypothetical protein
MATRAGLNSSAIAKRIIDQLDGIGIRSKEQGQESETAKLIKVIIHELVFALQAEARIDTVVQTTGSPNSHTGFGRGGIT